MGELNEVTSKLYIDIYLKQDLLRFVLEHVEDRNVEVLIEVCEILILSITFPVFILRSNSDFQC